MGSICEPFVMVCVSCQIRDFITLARTDIYTCLYRAKICTQYVRFVVLFFCFFFCFSLAKLCGVWRNVSLKCFPASCNEIAIFTNHMVAKPMVHVAYSLFLKTDLHLEPCMLNDFAIHDLATNPFD